MNKQELIDAVAAETGETKASTERTLSEVLRTVRNTLRDGEPVVLVGFGVFEVRRRKERSVRNPKTGEILAVPAKFFPRFRPSKDLKDVVAVGPAGRDGLERVPAAEAKKV